MPAYLSYRTYEELDEKALDIIAALMRRIKNVYLVYYSDHISNRYKNKAIQAILDDKNPNNLYVILSKSPDSVVSHMEIFRIDNQQANKKELLHQNHNFISFFQFPL